MTETITPVQHKKIIPSPNLIGKEIIANEASYVRYVLPNFEIRPGHIIDWEHTDYVRKGEVRIVAHVSNDCVGLDGCEFFHPLSRFRMKEEITHAGGDGNINKPLSELVKI